MKKKRKPRTSEIRVDFGRDQTLSGMEVSDGTLKLFGENGAVVTPAKIDIGSSYMRPAKQPKVLTRVASEPERIQLDPNHLLSRFAFILAVDTNTIQIGVVKVSISVPVIVKDIEIGEHRWNAKLVSQDAFEFHDAVAPLERIGWWETINRISSIPETPKPVALIVDSDLGSLASFNARREPILEGFYLPEDIELIYGCSDRGTQEFIANAAIADCDRVASRLLEKLMQQGVDGEYFVAEKVPYTRFRYWTPPTGVAQG